MDNQGGELSRLGRTLSTLRSQVLPVSKAATAAGPTGQDEEPRLHLDTLPILHNSLAKQESESPRSRQRRSEQRDMVIDGLDEDYYQDDFDPLRHELAKLPPNPTPDQLEAVVDERSGILEAVSEKLSVHVLKNWDTFVQGVNKVASVMEDLQAAHFIAKKSRDELARALADVGINMRVIQCTRRKGALIAMLEGLLRLQATNDSRLAITTAQENGEYTEAFWLAGQCCRALEGMGHLRVAEELIGLVDEAYRATTQHLEEALLALCARFQPEQYAKVLEGFNCVADVQHLGAELNSSFHTVVASSVLKVTRGVVMTRPSLQKKASGLTSLQEYVRVLPADLFRACYARVLMVIYDVLSSHFAMVQWHQSALEKHAQKMAGLQQTKAELMEQLAAAERADEEAKQVLAAAAAGRKAEAGDESWAAVGGQLEASDLPQANGQHEERESLQSCTAATPGAGGKLADGDAAKAAVGKLEADEAPQGNGHAEEPVLTNGHKEDGHAARQESLHKEDGHAARRESLHELERVHAQLGDIEEREEEEVAWGELVAVVLEALIVGRQDLWDEGARRVAVLLSSSAAFQAEHFLQVMEWTQKVLSIGEAFAGCECDILRDALERQSGKFFEAWHSSNMLALHGMLQREAFGQLVLTADRVPNLTAALQEALPPTSESPLSPRAAAKAAGFDRWAAAGNPWKLQRPAVDRHTSGNSADPDRRVSGDSLADSLGEDRREEAEELVLADGAEGADGFAAGSSSGGSAALGIRDTAEGSLGAAVGGTDTLARGGLAGSSGGAASGDPAEVAEASNNGAAGVDLERVASGEAASTSGQEAGSVQLPTATAGSWRVWRWMADYAELMSVLRSDLPKVYIAMCELFELYLVHTFRTFADVELADVVAATTYTPQQQVVQTGGGVEGVPLRLRTVLQRICLRSLTKYRPLILPHNAASAAAQLSAAGLVSSFTNGAAGGLGSLPERPKHTGSVLWNSGNMFGMMERKVAMDALAAVQASLTACEPAIKALLARQRGIPEHYSADALSETVAAAADVAEYTWRTAARLNLPLGHLAELIAAVSFQLDDPPTRASPWVKELLHHAVLFAQRLDSVPTLSPDDLIQIWRHALDWAAECVLAGLARVTRRCTVMGRSAMSLDLQAASKGLQAVLPLAADAALRVPDAMRVVDTYIKAFYIPWGPELRQWAAEHTEYSRAQLLALVACIAESQGLKRKERNALTGEIEADLAGTAAGFGFSGAGAV